ncbi:MAG: ABC transporter permease [Phycisphaerales bacterium]|nr:ABC transporter permease [Phycisphaerales bacterium]
MKKYHPIKELLLGRMRTFYREPEAIFWTYGFPLILTILLGIAFRNRPQEVIDVDIADGPAAAGIKSHLDDAGGFVAHVRPTAECTERLRLGKSAIVVERGDKLEYAFDPTRPDSALARARLDDVLQRALGRADAVATADREITEPGARYIDFLVPGLLGMNLMGGGLWGIGFVVTDMRVRNLLRRLVATPMRKPHFLLALIGGRLVFTIPELLFILGAGVFLFDVRVSGGWLAIVVIAFVGSVSFAGLGLLIASRAKRIETISGLMNLVMLPMWLFSGIFFSSEKFPDAFQPFIQALPLTQLNDALRSIILEGGTLADQAMRLLILMAWGGLSFLLALKWFRWT